PSPPRPPPTAPPFPYTTLFRSDGRRDDALREAQDCIAQKPGGRFAVAAQSLIERVQTRPGPTLRRNSGVGPRTELVIESTLVGADRKSTRLNSITWPSRMPSSA